MERKSFIKKHIVIFIIAIIAIIVLSVMVRYSVEGETNLPFEISKIMIISTAGGNQKENSEIKWDLNLIQINDIYINIIKNKNYNEEEIINKVIINNFVILEEQKRGNIQIYRPSNEWGIFSNKEEYKIQDEIIYTGAEASNLDKLEIANQGGLILLRYVNEDIGEYSSNEDTEIRHDGTLLGKIGLSKKDISFKVSFDISIELKSEKKYKTTIILDMPSDDLIESGTTNYQINKDNIIFKRY